MLFLEEGMQWSEEYKDKLTGFWRVDVLFDYLDEQIKEKTRTPLKKEEKQFCLLLFDLDHFKMLNDRYGHLFGDKVIQFVASKISEACSKKYPNQSFLIRYGGDEMVVVLDGVEKEEARGFATSLLDDITDSPFFSKIEDFDVTASAGLAVFPDDSTEAKELFELADHALYISKKFRNNKVTSADRAKYVDALSRIRLFLSFICFVGFLLLLAYLAYTFVFHKTLGGPVNVIFKYGGSLQGRVVYQDNQKIILQLEDGKSNVTIMRDRIKAIEAEK